MSRINELHKKAYDESMSSWKLIKDVYHELMHLPYVHTLSRRMHAVGRQCAYNASMVHFNKLLEACAIASNAIVSYQNMDSIADIKLNQAFDIINKAVKETKAEHDFDFYIKGKLSC